MQDLFSGLQVTKMTADRLGFFFAIEEIQVRFLLSLITDFDPSIFVDIGSNVGAYSLLVSKRTRVPEVIAFEPSPTAMLNLKKNVDLNKFADRIKTYECALSSRNGSANFFDYGAGSGKNCIVETSIHETDGQPHIVECRALDDIVTLTKSRAVMKIDVEGHELDALKGAVNLLRNNEIILQIEEGFQPQESRASDCRSYLEGIEYQRLIKVGPDAYYSNMAIESEQLLGNLASAETERLRQSWKRFGHAV